mmetsp:Transcript_62053/g.183350  ORF Transcript_62053/g.183350 Transcript_62053/m.183350 type:complete len:85 (+) Transcript_62053:1563-1817(+)
MEGTENPPSASPPELLIRRIGETPFRGTTTDDALDDGNASDGSWKARADGAPKAGVVAEAVNAMAPITMGVRRVIIVNMGNPKR